MAKLLEMVGLAVHVGPNIEENSRFAFLSGENRGQSRSVDDAQRAGDQLGGRHDRTGVTRADEAGHSRVPHQAGGHLNRRVPLSPHGGSRRILHHHHFASVDDFDGQAVQFILVEALSDAVFLPYQYDRDPVL